MKLISFKIEIDDLNMSEEEKNKGYREIIFEVIKSIIYAYASENRGLNEEERRKFYKVCDSIEKIIENKSDIIELEDQYALFIKECKNKCKLLPNKLTQRVEKLIDEMVDKDTLQNGK